MAHFCLNGFLDDEQEEEQGKQSEWETDAQGIPLCKVCDTCREHHLSKYRPEILTGYTQADVNEPIEPEE